MKYDPTQFEAFCWYHLTHLMKYPITDFHREIMSCLVNDRIAVAAPRGFAKSTWCSHFFPLYMLLENPGIRIVIVSATGKMANNWIIQIRRELETNPTLKEFYGDQDGSSSNKWTEEELVLPNGSHIEGKGSGKQIRGLRKDLIILDDVETDEMVRTPEQMEKFENWFNKTVTPAVKDRGSKIVLIGTILHDMSFLSRICHQGRHKWKTRLYRAIRSDETSLWEDKFPLEYLQDIKQEIGSYAFDQEYMNMPIPDDRRTFQSKWFRYFEKEPETCNYFITVDPAIEIKKTNDPTAIVVCGVDHDDNIYVVDYINERTLPNETIDNIFNLYKVYNPNCIGIEINGFQKMLKYEIDKQKTQRRVYPVIREMHSHNRRKHLRIQALQPFFERGKIFIKENQKELITQLKTFPAITGHDDIIDALAYQLDIVRASPRQATRINPNSFMAVYESNKKLPTNSIVWGKHKVRI